MWAQCLFHFNGYTGYTGFNVFCSGCGVSVQSTHFNEKYVLKRIYVLRKSCVLLVAHIWKIWKNHLNSKKNFTLCYYLYFIVHCQNWSLHKHVRVISNHSCVTKSFLGVNQSEAYKSWSWLRAESGRNNSTYSSRPWSSKLESDVLSKTF